MTVALLETPPLMPPAGLGPYRRDDYEALPDEPLCELIQGRFHVSPSPTLLHQVVASLLWRFFDRLAMESGGIAAQAVDVHLADHSVVQPDVLYIRPENRRIAGRWIEGAPDLVVEVLSPGNVRRDRNDKLALYADSGIGEYWIVDSVERQIEFLVLRNGSYAHPKIEGTHYRSAFLPEVQIDLEEFWTTVEQRFPGEHPSS